MKKIEEVIDVVTYNKKNALMAVVGLLTFGFVVGFIMIKIVNL